MAGVLDILFGALNAIDLPRSSAVDLLMGENPIDQWADPFGTSGRRSGRDLLTKWGLTGQNKETGMSGWLDDPGEGVADVAGFAVDALIDPLNAVPFGKLFSTIKTRRAAGLKNKAIDTLRANPERQRAIQEMSAALRERVGPVVAAQQSQDLADLADSAILHQQMNPDLVYGGLRVYGDGNPTARPYQTKVSLEYPGSQGMSDRDIKKLWDSEQYRWVSRHYRHNKDTGLTRAARGRLYIVDGLVDKMLDNGVSPAVVLKTLRQNTNLSPSNKTMGRLKQGLFELMGVPSTRGPSDFSDETILALITKQVDANLDVEPIDRESLSNLERLLYELHPREIDQIGPEQWLAGGKTSGTVPAPELTAAGSETPFEVVPANPVNPIEDFTSGEALAPQQQTGSTWKLGVRGPSVSRQRYNWTNNDTPYGSQSATAFVGLSLDAGLSPSVVMKTLLDQGSPAVSDEVMARLRKALFAEHGRPFTGTGDSLSLESIIQEAQAMESIQPLTPLQISDILASEVPPSSSRRPAPVSPIQAKTQQGSPATGEAMTPEQQGFLSALSQMKRAETLANKRAASAADSVLSGMGSREADAVLSGSDSNLSRVQQASIPFQPDDTSILDPIVRRSRKASPDSVEAAEMARLKEAISRQKQEAKEARMQQAASLRAEKQAVKAAQMQQVSTDAMFQDMARQDVLRESAAREALNADIVGMTESMPPSEFRRLLSSGQTMPRSVDLAQVDPELTVVPRTVSLDGNRRRLVPAMRGFSAQVDGDWAVPELTERGEYWPVYPTEEEARAVGLEIINRRRAAQQALRDPLFQSPEPDWMNSAAYDQYRVMSQLPPSPVVPPEAFFPETVAGGPAAGRMDLLFSGEGTLSGGDMLIGSQATTATMPHELVHWLRGAAVNSPDIADQIPVEEAFADAVEAALYQGGISTSPAMAGPLSRLQANMRSAYPQIPQRLFDASINSRRVMGETFGLTATRSPLDRAQLPSLASPLGMLLLQQAAGRYNQYGGVQ